MPKGFSKSADCFKPLASKAQDVQSHEHRRANTCQIGPLGCCLSVVS